ncbi:hypothetical protein [uncultured Merdimonas sp.]|uniref:hypothetical protein n=1 Tax=uncultured Merdimonas sp. TaxID=2023269 RepID=UPI00320A9AF1
MARLVTKFKYLKPDQEKPIGGYATYIATREGVEKIDESFKLAPATVKQQKLIEKILRDFPDSVTMLEYEDYQREKTVGAASEFITRAIEDNAHEILNQKTYADYIGTRPGAERFGSHGVREKDGVKLSTSISCSSDLAMLEDVTAAVAEDLKAVGFEVTTSSKETMTYYQDVNRGEYGIGIGITFNIPMDPFQFIANLRREPMRDNMVAQGLQSLPGSDALINSLYSMANDSNFDRNPLRGAITVWRGVHF